MLSVSGRTWNLCWRSCAALGAYVGGLGPLLEPMLAVLRRSWGLCWRSEAALGIYVGGPGGPAGPERWDRWDRWDGPDRSEGPVRIFSVDREIEREREREIDPCLVALIMA